MFSLTQLSSAYPHQLWLEFAQEDLAIASQNSQNYSNPVAQWRAFVNELCLNTFLKWLKTESDLQEEKLVQPHRNSLASIWEFVTGTSLEIGGTKLVLVPSETIELDEFCVPQEWVDIPSWQGDYYLAVQVYLEENQGWMRIWGFTNYQTLKAGNFDPIQRIYSLDHQDLTKSFEVLWLARKVCPETQKPVETLPELSNHQVEAMMETLTQKVSHSPRLALNFQEWGFLLENEKLRWQLYWQRLQYAKSQQKPALSQVFKKYQKETSLAFQKAGWQWYQETFQPQKVNFAFRKAVRNLPPRAKLEKTLEIAHQRIKLQLILELKSPKDGQKSVGIFPQIQISDPQAKLPENLQILILDESGNVFAHSQVDESNQSLKINQFGDSPGSKFSIKLIWNEGCVIESFEI